MIFSPEMSGRWILAWRLLSAATFLVVGLAALTSVPPHWAAAGRFWVLFGLLMLWYVLVARAGRERIIAAEPWSFGLFGLGPLIWAFMLPLHPATYAFAAVMFPTTYSHLSIRYSLPTGLVLTGIMYLAGNHWRVHVGIGDVLAALLVVASSTMLALFIHGIIRQSVERKRLIGELESTRASLAAAERTAGMLAERQRLAQQIHDTVAQGYVGIVTHLEAAEAVLGGGDAGVRKHVAEAKASARASLDEARRLVWDLRPDLLDGAPLPVVLARQLGEWTGKTGVAASQVVTGTARPLDANRETALLQAVREGLNNIRSHARASRVTVTLSYMDDEVALDIKDDGRGFSPDPAEARPRESGGFGLRALDERVRGLGGRLAVETAPGEGTLLTVSLPLEPAP